MALIASVASLTASPALSQPKSQDDIAWRLDELERLRRELEAKEGDVRQDIAAADERRDALTEELAELQAIVDEVQGRVDVAASELSGVQAQLDKKNAAIKKATKLLQRQLDDLNERAVQVYKHGPTSIFDLLTQVEGLADLIRRFGFMTQVVKKDNRRITDIGRAKALIVKDRDKIEELRDQVAKQLAVVASERNRAASVRNLAASRHAAVSGELNNAYGQLGDIKAQRASYEKESAQLQAESAAIAQFLRGRGGTPAKVSPKGMTWPASGPITSGFGWRTHPIFGTRRFHAGIDIGAPSGASIVAAGSGTVIFAGPKSGYGNATIIDHGGGIATLYGHQSSIGVSNGTPVTIGQRIGSVGCTGYCTGPHLHFEVRVNGDPVDPMGWLP
jgi:murein DD-endopeptidase MepM/ murein hydrolase activator NlpD